MLWLQCDRETVIHAYKVYLPLPQVDVWFHNCMKVKWIIKAVCQGFFDVNKIRSKN